MFGIDDAHWIDHDSWAFLLDLALDPNAILLLSARPLTNTTNNTAMKEILDHPNTIVLELEGLTTQEMVELACGMLGVDELPNQVVEIIRTRSHGVPLWCEELVETMLEMKVLQVVEQDEVIKEEDEEETEVEAEGNDESSSPTALMPLGEEHSSEAIEQQPNCTGRANRRLVLKTARRRRSSFNEEIGIGDIPIPGSLAGMVLTRIDHMSPSDQMSLKCASVIGTTFSRNMLEAVIPKHNPTAFHRSLNALAEAGIIECAIAAEVKSRMPDMHSRSFHPGSVAVHDDPHLQCSCLKDLHKSHHHTHHHKTGAKHPPVPECQTLQFVHTYIQETAYGLWTESQRQSLHEATGLYLESQAHKCVNCGGGGFIVGGHRTNETARRASTTPAASGGGRALMGASNMRNKLRRRSTQTGGSRRSSRVSSIASVAATPSLTELRDRRASQDRRLSEQVASLPSSRGQVRFDSICAADIIDLDLQDCHCDEVLAQVFPQLVHHWRAAGCVEKTLHYLLEAAVAAVATFNNMEAISLLEEAKQILRENKRSMLTQLEQATLESLFGQVKLTTLVKMDASSFNIA